MYNRDPAQSQAALRRARVCVHGEVDGGRTLREEERGAGWRLENIRGRGGGGGVRGAQRSIK